MGRSKVRYSKTIQEYFCKFAFFDHKNFNFSKNQFLGTFYGCVVDHQHDLGEQLPAPTRGLKLTKYPISLEYKGVQGVILSVTLTLTLSITLSVSFIIKSMIINTTDCGDTCNEWGDTATKCRDISLINIIFYIYIYSSLSSSISNLISSFLVTLPFFQYLICFSHILWWSNVHNLQSIIKEYERNRLIYRKLDYI